MKVLLTGSSGLVGSALTQDLVRAGHTVVRLVRYGASASHANETHAVNAAPEKSSNAQTSRGEIVNVTWNPRTCDLEGEPFGDEREKVEEADAVVNLAGAPIAAESWGPERKALLRSSRIQFTRELVCALEKLSAPPRALISASAIGCYGDRGDEVLTEESRPGEDFLARLAQEWEAEAVKAETFGVRVVRLRLGIILSSKGGALPQMMKPFRFGFGGRIGSGRQWISWITLTDVVRAIGYLLQSETGGALNLVAPNPVRNSEFVEELGRAMHRPALLPVPAFALEFALGEMARALLLASQRVVPARLQQLGFQFSHAQLAPAIADALAR